MDRFQFSVRKLLLLTTEVALIFAIVFALDLPALVRMAMVSGYVLIIGGLRWLTAWKKVGRRKVQLREHRRELEREVESRRAAHHAGGAPGAEPQRGDRE